MTPSFYGYDGQGNVRQLTNGTGAVTDTYEYDAFGNKWTVSGTTPNNYLYRGEQYDPDLGPYYLRARYYNPLSGRFAGVDPLTDEGGPPYGRHTGCQLATTRAHLLNLPIYIEPSVLADNELLCFICHFRRLHMVAKIGSVVTLVVLAQIVSNGHAQSPFLFDTVAVSIDNYEKLPQTARQMCKRELNYQKEPFTVYARITSGESAYYAVMGANKNDQDDQYYGGVLLEIHANLCRGLDLERVLGFRPPRGGYRGESTPNGVLGDGAHFEGVPPNRHYVFKSAAEESLLRDLIKDAIHRDAEAHGGDKNFRSQACKASVEAQLLQADYPIVLQELKTYCGSSPPGGRWPGHLNPREP